MDKDGEPRLCNFPRLTIFDFFYVAKLSVTIRKYGDFNMVMFLKFFTNMVILNMVMFLEIAKYGNMSYGNVFENYYHIFTLKYGKKKTYAPPHQPVNKTFSGFQKGLS